MSRCCNSKRCVGATRRRRNRCRKPNWRCWRSRGGLSEPCDGQSSPSEKELWKCRVRGKSGKPNPGFPLFPPPLGNLANPARFPHSHSSGGPRLEKWKNKITFSTFPHATRDDDDYFISKNQSQNQKQNQTSPPPAAQRQPKKGEHHAAECRLRTPIFRLTPHWNQDSFSGSFRIGIKHRFQAHFRIGKCSWTLLPCDLAEQAQEIQTQHLPDPLLGVAF